MRVAARQVRPVLADYPHCLARADALPELMRDKDPAKSSRVMKAMLQMDKIDIKKLKQAYDGQ